VRGLDGPRRCGRCGALAAPEAHFCGQCGSSLDVDLSEPLPVGDRTGAVPAPASNRSRLGTLFAVVGLAGVVGLLLVLTKNDPSGDETREPAPDERSGTSVSTTSTVEPTTSPSDATTTNTTTGGSEIVFVNDTPGPVLEDGIEGTLVGVRGRIVHRIDLATGATQAIEVGDRIGGLPNPWGPVVIGDELVTTSALAGEMIRTALVTGNQSVVELDVLDEACCLDVVGQAGSDSVWLVTATVAYEIDLSGQIRRDIEVPEGFSVSWAQDAHLYLDGPDGSYRYDTTTGTATEITGAVIGIDPLTTVSCHETLECQVLAETGSGPVVLSALTGPEVSNGAIRISPDLSGALVQTWPDLGYVDLMTGNRVDLGRFEGDVSGVVWIPESRWVIMQASPFAPGPTTGLVALNTETAERADIEAEGLIIGLDDAFLFVHDTPA
jgi:hypothetical protein